MRPVGVGAGRKGARPSQAQCVGAWLGTYELLVNQTLRYTVVGDRREYIQTPSPDALAAAATAIVEKMDFDEPWWGGTGHPPEPPA